MPTPKQVRDHYKKIRYHLYRLRCALNNAHNVEVIQYGQYADGPCAAMDELVQRIETTTEKTRAQAFKQECMNELKGVW